MPKDAWIALHGAALDGAFRACDDPSVPLSEVRARFQAVVDELPEDPRRALAREHVAVLDRMIVENAGHVCPGSLDELSEEDRALELIHHLQDQDGWEGLGRAPAQVLPNQGPSSSPAARLRDMGFAAVPHLLRILEDERLTRTVRHRGRSRPPRVLRYGDAAVDIIAAIACVPTIRRPEAARRWWREVEGREPFAYHLEGFRTGVSPTLHAGRLLELDASRGLEVLLDEIPGRAPDDRRGLVRLLQELSAPGVVPFLCSELGGPATLEAARVLVERGLGGWTDQVAARMTALGEPGTGEGVFSPDDMRLSDHWVLLVRHGGERGLAEALDHYDRTGRRRRLALLQYLGLTTSEDPELRRWADRAFVHALDDRAAIRMRTRVRGREVVVRRVCEEAARILVERWEVEEPFPVDGGRAERDRFIARLRARWESRRGKE